MFINIDNSKELKDVEVEATNNVHNIPSGKVDRSIVSNIGSADTGLLDKYLLFSVVLNQTSHPITALR